MVHSYRSEIMGESVTKKNLTINTIVGGGLTFLGKGLTFLGAGSLQTALVAAGVITPFGMAATLTFYGVVAGGTFLSVFIAMKANEATVKKYGDNAATALLIELDKVTKKRDDVLKFIDANIDDIEKIKTKKSELKVLTNEMKSISRELSLFMKSRSVDISEEQKAFLFRVTAAGRNGKLSLIDLRGGK